MLGQRCPDGKVTDFRMAVKAEENEEVSLAGLNTLQKRSATLLIKRYVGPTDERVRRVHAV